ncbi:uncharacterized protein B0T23DRAFT_381857 [Neurospora hispaniola]|uniref:Uncharacterized protein n=1 Tax=Neurospora hispaniola TaxID=588809 RepID=A0AAJ0I5R8_9PEZI|nr:hypothetical protein B0T23DRAFT_381857 [Neurospora hispaniola]
MSLRASIILLYLPYLVLSLTVLFGAEVGTSMAVMRRIDSRTAIHILKLTNVVHIGCLKWNIPQWSRWWGTRKL